MTSANERWTQRIMGGLGVRPVGHADPNDDDSAQIPAQSPVPPQPPGLPSSPRMPDWRRSRRSTGQKPDEHDGQEETEPAANPRTGRLPDWWRTEKPPLAAADAEDENTGSQPSNPDKADLETLMREWLLAQQAPTAKTDDPDAAEDAEETGEEQDSARPASRWSRPALGRPPGLPEKKHNVFTWWRDIELHNKWLLYHGTGLAGGIWLGAFQKGMAGHEFVAHHDPGSVDVLATHGMGIAWILIDYRARQWHWLLAWAVRGVTTSSALGVLWYSTPLGQ